MDNFSPGKKYLRLVKPVTSYLYDRSCVKMSKYLRLLLIIEKSASAIIPFVDGDVVVDAFVVVVDGNRQRLLGNVLTDDVFVLKSKVTH